MSHLCEPRLSCRGGELASASRAPGKGSDSQRVISSIRNTGLASQRVQIQHRDLRNQKEMPSPSWAATSMGPISLLVSSGMATLGSAL